MRISPVLTIDAVATNALGSVDWEESLFSEDCAVLSSEGLSCCAESLPQPAKEKQRAAVITKDNRSVTHFTLPFFFTK